MSLELPTEFNLEPHPRILPMLGEINLSQPRCVAELVDNAVDAFLSSKRSGARVDGPEVSVNLPTFDSPSAKLIVLDNGPGMDLLTLEKAVKAGWTGNDPISSLGMFGMGFNIATARLGVVTRVWTTREGDAEWYGLEINFEKLVRQGHFRTNPLTRPKQDRFQHGTEVSIETLKPEHRQWFAKAGNRSKLAQEFSRAYAAMLRSNGVPISFRLKVNGNLVQGHNHCVWGGEGNPNREVPTSRYGVINAHQPVDVRLPERPFCVACWQWLPVGEAKCSACQSEKDVVVRSRRVYGWLGIQRYLSAADYGIDFIRNGRKIEIAIKGRSLKSTSCWFRAASRIAPPRHPLHNSNGAMAMTEVTGFSIVAGPVTEVIAPGSGALYPATVDSQEVMPTW